MKDHYTNKKTVEETVKDYDTKYKIHRAHTVDNMLAPLNPLRWKPEYNEYKGVEGIFTEAEMLNYLQKHYGQEWLVQKIRKRGKSKILTLWAIPHPDSDYARGINRADHYIHVKIAPVMKLKG